AAPGVQHEVARFVDVRIARPEHPIVRGARVEYRPSDALIDGLAVRPNAEGIVSVPGGAGGHAEGDLALGASDLSRGRVVGLALGHDASAMHEKGFATLFARSSEWVASGAVTLPPEFGLGGPRPEAVKALLITGGHDHEAAFYTL